MKCDICGKDTYINPPYEIDEEEVEVDSFDFKTMKPTKVKIPMAKKGKMKRQNVFSGEVEEIEVPITKDLKPRAYMVQLQVGPSEYVQRDFCLECLESIKPQIKTLWDCLESIKPK